MQLLREEKFYDTLLHADWAVLHNRRQGSVSVAAHTGLLLAGRNLWGLLGTVGICLNHILGKSDFSNVLIMSFPQGIEWRTFSRGKILRHFTSCWLSSPSQQAPRFRFSSSSHWTAVGRAELMGTVGICLNQLLQKSGFSNVLIMSFRQGVEWRI